MATVMYSGLFYNLCEVDTINFDHSWWMPNTVETYGIGEHVYAAQGDFGHSYYSGLGLIAYNVTLGESFGVENAHGNLYDTVYSGKWTLDKMLEIGTAYGQDNGDGAMTFGDDVFGCVVTNVPSRLFLFSLGHELITLNETEDGVKIPTSLDEKTISSYERLYAAFPQNGSGTFPNCIAVQSGADAPFAEDKILMYTAYFMNLGTEEVRNMTSEYMIMPMPKYDENQANYVAEISHLASVFAIPATTRTDIGSMERTGHILEYMAFKSNEILLPVYYDEVLKGQRLDGDDAAMLDIIANATHYEFAKMYKMPKNERDLTAQDVVTRIFKTPQSAASTYNSNKSKLQKELNEYFTKVLRLASQQG
jgi:hypothetical protein